ncbi:MAG TPA: flagellar basal body rod protein FlgB [Ignavibacteria bacterium]|nr:flagellar basal body rod protein FlgB [Ignavibacteria bacterium]
MPQSTIKLLENFANYYAVKQKVIANNIANIGTENYKRLDVKFKDVLDENLKANLKTTEENHIAINTSDYKQNFEIVKDQSMDNASGINNVDIDTEMAELAANNLNFKFATMKIRDYFKTMQGVIRGGGSL